jgi:hypothetical protein
VDSRYGYWSFVNVLDFWNNISNKNLVKIGSFLGIGKVLKNTSQIQHAKN